MQKTEKNKNLGKRDKRLFFSGVLFLTIGNIVVKLTGLVFKIPLTNILGDQGMAYFNSAYQIYAWLFMLSTAGLPVAVSILISESRATGDLKRVNKIFSVSMRLFVCLGVAGMAVMIFGARALARLINIDNSVYCIMAIAPTLFFICIASALRGYFQGFQRMGPSAVSQIIEALGKLIIGVMFALIAQRQGKPVNVIAAYAIFGIAVGAAAGMVYLLIAKLIYTRRGMLTVFGDVEVKSETGESGRGILPRLIKIAIPITISASVMSLTSLIDLGIITNRLVSAGFSQEAAEIMYGNYTSLAVPMVNLPPVLIYPISSSIIPLVSAMLASKNLGGAKKVMESALRVASLISIPCALGMSALSYPILTLFFKPASSATAAPLLSILSIAIFFVGMISVSNAVLQANHRERLPIISMFAGAIVKIVSSYILLGIPSVNIYGTPISTLLCYITAAAFDVFFVAKYVGIRPSVKSTFMRPLFAGVICAASAYGLYCVLNIVIGGRIATLLAIFLAILIYAVLIFAIRCVTKDDILYLPHGNKIYSILHKIKLLK